MNNFEPTNHRSESEDVAYVYSTKSPWPEIYLRLLADYRRSLGKESTSSTREESMNSALTTQAIEKEIQNLAVQILEDYARVKSQSDKWESLIENSSMKVLGYRITGYQVSSLALEFSRVATSWDLSNPTREVSRQFLNDYLGNDKPDTPSDGELWKRLVSKTSITVLSSHSVDDTVRSVSLTIRQEDEDDNSDSEGIELLKSLLAGVTE